MSAAKPFKLSMVSAADEVRQQLDKAYALIDAVRAALLEHSDIEGRAHYIGGTGANGVCIDGPSYLIEWPKIFSETSSTSTG